ncbi:Bifunctional epoxide hydrolase 2 [Mortierella sp. 14UC]|nr:Bifunctional epoxide hydrolase 2 [Mortierella sp. 14UC]
MSQADFDNIAALATRAVFEDGANFSIKNCMDLALANVDYIETVDAAKPATAPGYEPSSFNHKYTTLGGYNYQDYVEEGDPNGQTLVLIHGFPDLWYGWRYQIRHLASQGYHVIAVDNLGSGETDMPKCVGLEVAPYASKNLAKNLVELLDQLDVDKAVFIGHDWGGFVTWKVGMHFPERCHAVISVGVPHHQPGVEPFGPREYVAASPLFSYMHEFESPEVEGWYDGNVNTFAIAFFNMVYGTRPGTNVEEKKFYIDSFTRTTFHGALNYYRASRVNHKDELPYLNKPYTVPSLLIVVETDPVLVPSYVRAVPKDLFLDLEQSSIATGGHNVHTENADEVNQELSRFLNKVFDEKLKLPKTKVQQEKKVQEQAAAAQEVAREE